MALLSGRMRPEPEMFHPAVDYRTIPAKPAIFQTGEWDVRLSGP
jgi:hypothetical protein